MPPPLKEIKLDTIVYLEVRVDILIDSSKEQNHLPVQVHTIIVVKKQKLIEKPVELVRRKNLNSCRLRKICSGHLVNIFHKIIIAPSVLKSFMLNGLKPLTR